MTKADIKFKVSRKRVRFYVYHNLPNVKGLSMDDAVVNWIYRTHIHTAESLCDYINNKQTGYSCMMESQFFNQNQIT